MHTSLKAIPFIQERQSRCLGPAKWLADNLLQEPVGDGTARPLGLSSLSRPALARLRSAFRAAASEGGSRQDMGQWSIGKDQASHPYMADTWDDFYVADTL